LREPDAVVEEGLPENMNKAPENMEGEANLRRHLRNEGEGNNSQEETGSSSYVSPEKNKDTQLQYALGLMRGIRSVDTNANQQ
jgi:carboxyl-terminal processing protease